MLAGVVDAVGADRVNLLGASSGCPVAATYAADAPGPRRPAGAVRRLRPRRGHRLPGRPGVDGRAGGGALGPGLPGARRRLPARRHRPRARGVRHASSAGRRRASWPPRPADRLRPGRHRPPGRTSAARRWCCTGAATAPSRSPSAGPRRAGAPRPLRRAGRRRPLPVARRHRLRRPGGRPVPDRPRPRAGDTAPPAGRAATLSERELEVLRLVARGRTDAEIAEQLVLSVHTVHRHVANIRTRLGVTSRAAAAAWAVRPRAALTGASVELVEQPGRAERHGADALDARPGGAGPRSRPTTRSPRSAAARASATIVSSPSPFACTVRTWPSRPARTPPLAAPSSTSTTSSYAVSATSSASCSRRAAPARSFHQPSGRGADDVGAVDDQGRAAALLGLTSGTWRSPWAGRAPRRPSRSRSPRRRGCRTGCRPLPRPSPARPSPAGRPWPGCRRRACPCPSSAACLAFAACRRRHAGHPGHPGHAAALGHRHHHLARLEEAVDELVDVGDLRPEPLAMRARREPSIIFGLARSAGVIDWMIASIRSISRSSKFSSWSLELAHARAASP